MSETIEALAAKASELRRTGPADAAVAAYERLLQANPDLPNSWYNLGIVLRAAGRGEDALAAYDEALKRGIAEPEQVHLNRAVIFRDTLQRDDLAEAELSMALQCNPAYIPALINLGNLEEDRGNRDAARRAYGKVLARRPWFFEALARYANLHTPSGADDPIIDRLRRGLAMPAPDALERASLGFALGRQLDAVGTFDEAFAAYAAANRDSSRALAAVAPPYDRAAQERLVDAVIAAFTPERMAALRHDDTASPIFICGMFRSGSTLCEQVLASHRDVTMGGELGLLPDLIRKQIPSFPDGLVDLDGDAVGALAQAYRTGLDARFAGRVTDKRPDNFLHIGLIKAMFPRARIIHTRRAPLDNCLSVYFLNLDERVPYARDLEDIAHYYGQYRRLMAHWQALFGADIFDFDYDHFVRDQQQSTRDLLAYCGLEWDEACLAFHETESLVRTASVWQVREPLYAHASGRAQNYAAHMAPLRAALSGQGVTL